MMKSSENMFWSNIHNIIYLNENKDKDKDNEMCIIYTYRREAVAH